MFFSLQEFSILKEGLFVVNQQTDPGIIQRNVTGFRCLTCGCCIVRCKHLNTFYKIHAEEVIQQCEREPYRQTCHSKKKIPFNSSFSMQTIYKTPYMERFLESGGILKIDPETDRCYSCGRNVGLEDNKKKSNLFLTNQILEIEGMSLLFYLVCL